MINTHKAYSNPYLSNHDAMIKILLDSDLISNTKPEKILALIEQLRVSGISIDKKDSLLQIEDNPVIRLANSSFPLEKKIKLLGLFAPYVIDKMTSLEDFACKIFSNYLMEYPESLKNIDWQKLDQQRTLNCLVTIIIHFQKRNFSFDQLNEIRKMTLAMLTALDKNEIVNEINKIVRKKAVCKLNLNIYATQKAN